MEAVRIFIGSKYYSDMLDSFSIVKNISPDFSSTEISRAIYFHICKMKYAGWRHRVNFKRKKKHSISEFFQDIIAFYLKVSLPEDYEIELETKIGKTQPDIVIKKNGIYHFIIETKTNIGWERPDKTSKYPYNKIKQRIRNLAKNFKIPTKNIIYVFEEHGNVSRKFSDKFWNSEKQRAVTRSTEFPFSIIYPLFNATDPYYWKHSKGFDKQLNFIKLSDNEILNRAKRNIVTPFEEILKKIITNSNIP